MLARWFRRNLTKQAGPRFQRTRSGRGLYWRMRRGGRATSLEIEIKLRIDDIAEILLRLRHIGARLGGRVFEQNALYDTADGSFQRSGCLLRIRRETPEAGHSMAGGTSRAVLTFKAPPIANSKGKGDIHRSRYKERAEREIEIKRPGIWPRQLGSLGLRPTFRYEKFRTSFRLKRLHLDLDETPAGTFLELEGAPREIDRAARALGFGPRDYIQGTYWDIYAADCRRRGSVPKNMVFKGQKAG